MIDLQMVLAQVIYRTYLPVVTLKTQSLIDPTIQNCKKDPVQITPVETCLVPHFQKKKVKLTKGIMAEMKCSHRSLEFL